MTGNVRSPGSEVDPRTRRSEEFQSLVKAIETYRDSKDDSSRDDLWRALGTLLATDLRDRFKAEYGVARAAESPCIGRLITGKRDPTCTCTSEGVASDREVGDGDDDPPHSAPHADHPVLWLEEDGEPAVYSMHLYNPSIVTGSSPATEADEERTGRNGVFDIVDFARKWGLDMAITPYSWYNLFSTVNIVLYQPERFRSVRG